MPKITMIGAGSVVFAKNLIGDILNFPELKNSQFSLMDINPERLRVAEAMTRKIIRQRGAEGQASVTSSLDRMEALRDADYVVNMIQIGGFDATLVDFNIPEKYGLKTTIADTLGVGGVMRALRTIPVVLDLCWDMEEVCPEALLMNYSNPMAMNCWAANEATAINTIGLCHGIRVTARQLAGYLGVDVSDLTYRVGGINHMAWFLELKHKGEDAYPMLWKAMENPEVWKKDAVRFELMKATGFFMTESSEHTAEYLPYFIQHEELIEKLDIPIREYIRRCEMLLGRFDEMKAAVETEKDLELKASGEYCSEIIRAMETGVPCTVNANVANTNLIPNLLEGCCVEVPCIVDHNGVQPTHFGYLPAVCAALNRTNINVQELAVLAALEGNREFVYQAAMLDPHTASVLNLDQIKAMCDELLSEHIRLGNIQDLD